MEIKKLKVYLENCYGIKKLEHEFDFSKKRVVVIYAPNGAMKTSFTKVFQKLKTGEKPKDEIFDERDSISNIGIIDEKNLKLRIEEVNILTIH